MPRSTIAESYGKFSFIRNCQTTFHGGCSLCILMSICCYHSFYCSHSDINNLRYADDTTLMAESEEELESLLMKVKEIQPVHPKGDQSLVFIGRTDVEAETPILWSPDAESWLIWRDPDAGKDWGQEEKGMTEDEMVGWHHRHNGHGFGWTLGVSDEQGGLRAAVHGVAKSQTQLSDWTELNWAEILTDM